MWWLGRGFVWLTHRLLCKHADFFSGQVDRHNIQQTGITRMLKIRVYNMVVNKSNISLYIKLVSTYRRINWYFCYKIEHIQFPDFKNLQNSIHIARHICHYGQMCWLRAVWLSAVFDFQTYNIRYIKIQLNRINHAKGLIAKPFSFALHSVEHSV